MAYETIRLDISPAAVATITLNRPDSLNALNSTLIEEMRSAPGGELMESFLLAMPPTMQWAGLERYWSKREAA